jgi:F-type H+-transporting ATPase subunit c
MLFGKEDSVTDLMRIGLPIMVGGAAIGGAIGIGIAVRGAMEAIGRQPEAASKIQMAMVIGCAFIEALTLYTMLIVFVLEGKLQQP